MTSTSQGSSLISKSMSIYIINYGIVVSLISKPMSIYMINYGDCFISWGTVLECISKAQLECAVDGAPSQIPTVTFGPTSTPSPTPGAITPATE